MVRQRFYHDPARKNIESYSNFSGGLNSVNANDVLRDTEMPNLKNIDLGTRGSLDRRMGTVRYWDAPTPGKAQGFFRYYKNDGTFEEMKVVGGEFYINDTPLTVGDGGAVIQTDRFMEAVQYRDKLYIASGSGLLEYDGNTLDFVTPYIPKDLEALYVGTNGLMQNPNDYIETTDGHAALAVKGVKFDKRYGVQNEFITLSAYAEKVENEDELEWKFERRLPSHKEGYWFLGQDWASDSDYTFSTEWTGDVQFRVSVRKKGDETAADIYQIPQYLVKPSEDPEDEIIPSDSIDTCNRILLHWDRLIMYGDTRQGDVIYISHLHNPAYFPEVNTLRFENPRKEGLTALVRFRDNIVAFTPTTVQGLYGKAPIGDDTYRRVMMHSSIGCIAPKSAKVIGNYIAFLSYEGIYYLKSLAYTETKTNVDPIDNKIHNLIPSNATDACAVVSGKQYRIVFPSSRKQLRFYYEYNTWTEDEHDTMDYQAMYFFNGRVYMQREDGSIAQESASLSDEGEIFESVFESKGFSFNEPHALKKLKEVQLRLEVKEETNVMFELLADEKVIRTENIPLVPGEELYKIPGFGEGLELKVRLTHKEAKPFKILGLGFIFKLKNP